MPWELTSDRMKGRKRVSLQGTRPTGRRQGTNGKGQGGPGASGLFLVYSYGADARERSFSGFYWVDQLAENVFFLEQLPMASKGLVPFLPYLGA